MSKVLNSIYTFFEDIGRARAAHQLAVLGHYNAAKSIMLDEPAKFEVHP